MIDENNITIDNRTIPVSKARYKKIYIHHPSISGENKKLDNKKNNLKISNSLMIFPLSKYIQDLNHVKKSQAEMINCHFYSTPNINKFESLTSNKNSLLAYHSFNFKYKKPKIPIDIPLYTILAFKKNQIMDKYDKDISIKKKEKIKNLKFLRNKNNRNLYSELNKNNNIFMPKKANDSIYLSCLNNNFVNSEKVRFYNMMERLNKIKMLIEGNPDIKYIAIKNFFINVGLDKKNYLSNNKINNFLKFIKNDFIVDPSKTLKENIINIIENNKDYLLFQRSIKNYGNTISSPSKVITKRIKNIMQINKNFYKCKNLKFNTLDKFKIKRFDLDLKLNLDKQKEFNKKNNNKELIDIVKEPQKIMNTLEDKLKEETNFKSDDKNYSDWRTNIIFQNYSNFNYVRSYDLDTLKKRNLLTEYACFKKAKCNYDLQQMKVKYNI